MKKKDIHGNQALEGGIAKNIWFPTNIEWFKGYENQWLSAVDLYRTMKPAAREAALKAPRKFMDANEDLQAHSDDSFDYMQPFYCYSSLEPFLKAIAKTLEAENWRQWVIRYAFIDPTRIEDDDHLDDLFYDWRDLGPTYKSLKDAYANGKVHLQFAKMIRKLKPTAIDWKALDWYYALLQKWWEGLSSR